MLSGFGLKASRQEGEDNLRGDVGRVCSLSSLTSKAHKDNEPKTPKRTMPRRMFSRVTSCDDQQGNVLGTRGRGCVGVPDFKYCTLYPPKTYSVL